MPILVAGTAPLTDLITIGDVAAHLNWDSTQQGKCGPEMARFISAVTPVVEHIIGPVVAQPFDEWFDGGGPQIILRRPVISVSLLTESAGNSLYTLTSEPLTDPGDGYGYTLDSVTGAVTRRRSGIASAFADGTQNVHVIYTAGMCADTSTVPANVALAALELIRINWQPQQGGNRPQMGANDTPVADAMHMGFFVPNRVMELLRPNVSSVGIA